MTIENSNISSLYKKYFCAGQFNYALKIADLGYACERIPVVLWRMYKKDCLQKLGSASSSLEYTEVFVHDINSLPFFSALYDNRELKCSDQIKPSCLKRLVNVINKFYSVNIDSTSFCEAYDNFCSIKQNSRFIELSFLEELVGVKVKLDVFKYLLSSKGALRSIYSGNSVSWLQYFLDHDFEKVLLDDTSAVYLSLYRPQSPVINFNKITHLRIEDKIAISASHPDEYILNWESKMIHAGEHVLSIEQFAISAITFNSWILVYTDDCKILSCELPSGEIVDQQSSFFTGNMLRSFLDSDLNIQHGSGGVDKSKRPDRNLVCINPVHFLRYLVDISHFPSFKGDLINFFIGTLFHNGVLEVKLNSILYTSSLEKEQNFYFNSSKYPATKIVSQQLSIRDALVVDVFQNKNPGIVPFLEQPLFSRHTIYQKEYNFEPKSRSCFVFCHFDALGGLKKSVQHYLNALSDIGDIIFVSNAPALSENAIALDFLNQTCMCVYVRDNDSYDFGCWAFGITRNLPQLRSQYDHLICCNDSCIGPFCDLKPILDDFIRGNIDVGGLTANKDRGLHLQSYFIFYGKNILNSSLFQNFWQNIRSWQNKNDIINYYEVSWLRVLILSGYKVSVYFSEYFDAFNNTVMKPLELMQSGFPFIKREVIEKNPFKINLKEFLGSVSKLHPEASDLIESIDPH